MHDQKYIFIFKGKPCKFVRPSLRIEIQQEGRPQTRPYVFCWGGGAKVRGNQGRTNGKAGSQWCREMVILKGRPQQLNHSFMATLKKTHKIKKLYNHHESGAQQQPDNETNVEPLSDSEHSLEKPYKDEAPIKRSIKIDPRQISNLTEEERLKIKTEHPEMNEYFCMSARDKSKFFHLLNQKYRQDIKLPEPPGSAPMKKTIRFKKRFQIKPFGYLQKCEAIKMRKSFMELYRAKDDSKSKPISKFPKNS